MGTKRAQADVSASAPSLQMAIDLLSDLAESAVDLSDDYEALSERLQNGGALEDDDVQVSFSA
jgi:nuclear pore complex protein Nup205